MRRQIALAVGVLLALSTGHAAAPQPGSVLVELFTSEGCESCPPADALLQNLIAGPATGVEIIGLGQHVDYWDRLGWKDRFSSAALTRRQQLYATRFNTESIYTPQMVVDGRAEFVGSDVDQARKAIDRALAAPHGVVHIEFEPLAQDVARPALHLRVTASDLPRSGRGDRADVIVAITEDRLHSNVTHGENHGRTLTHAAIVRQMVTIAEAAADGPTSVRAEIVLGSDWQRENLKIVAFVQERRGRAILASAVTPLQNVRR